MTENQIVCLLHNPSSKLVYGWTNNTKQIPVEIKNHTGQTGVGDICL